MSEGNNDSRRNEVKSTSRDEKARFESFEVIEGGAPGGNQRGGGGRGGRGGRDGENAPRGGGRRGGRGGGNWREDGDSQQSYPARNRGGYDGENAPRGGGRRGGRGGGNWREDGDDQQSYPARNRGGYDGENAPRGGGRGGRGGRRDYDEEEGSRRGGRGGRGGRGRDHEGGSRGGPRGGAGGAARDPDYVRDAPARQDPADSQAAPTKEGNEGARYEARGHGEGRGRGGGGEEGRGRGRGRNFPESDSTLTRPGRTQRAARFRHNNFDTKEVEEMFTHRHNQKGISFDNYERIEVDIIPKDIACVESFEGLAVDPHLAANLGRCGYSKPTPVQKYGIPVALAGGDLMACAQTGSGKTAAFLVPVIQHILIHGVSPGYNRMACPIGLILAPTRELALQIFEEVKKLVFKTDIFCDVAYGGKSYPHSFENDILVACPGRLKDLFDREKISFECVKFLILDEADRMLEMGFEEQIRYLCSSSFSDMPGPEDRQTLMFSATFPPAIRELAQNYLRKRYYLLTVGRVGSTTKNITQCLKWIEKSDKRDELMNLICEQLQTDLVLVFVETKREAEDLNYYLDEEGIPCNTIHGDRIQKDREDALKNFKNGTCPILVATDVASRGLDIPNVTHVIQYDLPKSLDDYTHRIGRTGRAGNKGVATSFFNKSNYVIAADLLAYLEEHDQYVPDWMEDAADEENAKRFTRGGGRSRGGDAADRARASEPKKRRNFYEDGGF